MAHVEEVPPERIPSVSLTLVAGFLGAGKTTLLNHLIRAEHEERIGVLVNDFGEINIDSELVAAVDGETITLSNGCICCTILDDMVLTLFRLLHRPDAPRHVIVECSGVSDPAAVLRGFEQAKLYDIVRVQSVVVVVDAEQFGELSFRDQPLALHQLVVSDLVVLNKVDLVESSQLEQLESRVRSTVPGARILQADHGKVPFDLVLGTGAFDADRLLGAPDFDVHVHQVDAIPDHGHDHGMEFATWAHRWQGPVDPPQLRAFLDELPVSIFRAKGIVEMEGESRRIIVQVVGKRVEIELGESWGEGERVSKFVIIGTPGEFDPTMLEAALQACVRPQTERPSLSGWIRRLWASGSAN